MAAVRRLCHSGLFVHSGVGERFASIESAISRYQTTRPQAVDEQFPIHGLGFDLCAFTVETLEASEKAIQPLADVRFTVVAKAHLRCEVAAYLRIEDEYGHGVFGLDSRDFGATTKVPHDLAVTWEFDVEQLPLPPGRYSASVMIRNDSDFTHWACPTVFPFEVVGDFAYGARLYDRKIHGQVAVRANAKISVD
jgi:hypothetical protein